MTLSPLPLARTAGLLALATLILGTFAGSVHARLVVPGDAAASAANIIANEALFRLGIAGGLAMYTVNIFYVLALYLLFRPLDRNLALVMALLSLIGVPIAMLNQVNQAAALLLLGGADYLGAFSADQLHALVMLFLKLHGQGNVIAVIFWGLWLFPLGLLVYRSGCFPGILGVLLMIGCFGWLLVVGQRLLWPDIEVLAYSRYAAHVAELSWMLWLLIRGVDAARWNARASEAQHRG
jgi:hypothetical protein